MNKLGVHWIPAHNRPEDYDYMTGLRADVVKIIDPDVAQISFAHGVNREALIILRDHPLSEQKGDMIANPEQTGKRHAKEWRDKVNLYRRQANERGIIFPDDEHILVLGINEPPVWDHLEATIKYNIAFLSELKSYGLRGGALNLSVGWPANTGTDTPPNWRPYKSLEPVIKDGNHILMLHEYWDNSGIESMWGWWAGRFTKCTLDVPIIIGECGIDEYVAGTVSDHMGWEHFYSSHPAAYVDQLHEYVAKSSQDYRFVAATPFTTDFGGREWRTFDTKRLHNIILSRNWNFQNSPPKEKIDIVLPFDGNHKITQHFGDNPDSYKPYKGHTGTDFATPMDTEINAVDDGAVAEVYELNDLGKYVKVIHSWGESVYAHLDRQLVTVNQFVRKGETIGKSGNTGNSTGPHLHLGIRVTPYDRQDGWNGYSDPELYLPKHSQPPVDNELVKHVKVNQKNMVIEVTAKYDFVVVVNDEYKIKIAK